IVLGVLIAATGVFVTVYAVERSAAEDVGRQIAVTERELAGVSDRLATIGSSVDELADTYRDLEAVNDVLRACTDPTKAALRAVKRRDDPGLSSAIEQMLLHCGR